MPYLEPGEQAMRRAIALGQIGRGVVAWTASDLVGSTRHNAQKWWKMKPLRTAVVMKTDIGGSTSRFRELFAVDLQTLLSNHLNFIAHHSAEHGGRIIKSAGDGYWLEFSSATGAARAAVEMQEALRLAEPSRVDDRLAIRIVIALGDVVRQDGDCLGNDTA